MTGPQRWKLRHRRGTAAALLAPWLPARTLAVALLLWRFATFYWYLLLGGAVFAVTVGRGPKPPGVPPRGRPEVGRDEVSSGTV